MLRRGERARGVSVSAVLVFLAACGGSSAAGGGSMGGCGGLDNTGGLNSGQKAPGDQPGGVALSIGDIAVSPSGEFIVFQRGRDLAVGWTSTGAVEVLPVVDPIRLAFSKQRPIVYVASAATGRVHAVDVASKKEAWTVPFAPPPEGAIETDPTRLRIVSSENDGRVLVSAGTEVVLVDAADGSVVETIEAPAAVVDLEILPDDDRALVVPAHEWDDDGAPVTHVTVVDLAGGGTRTFDVPNCADDVAVAPGGARAFLAPTTCSKDPISVLDLSPAAETFVKNLPGFGPVAIGPGGGAAVGFFDRTQADAALFDDPEQIPADDTARFQLMIVDPSTLTFELFEWGDTLPRYALTPDGSVLLVDAWASTNARLFDVATKTFRDIEGPALRLEEFAISSDSQHAYVLHEWTTAGDDGLFDLDLAAAKSRELAVDFVPMNLNLSPDDRTLFLRRSETAICVYDLETETCDADIVVGPVQSP